MWLLDLTDNFGQQLMLGIQLKAINNNEKLQLHLEPDDALHVNLKG